MTAPGVEDNAVRGWQPVEELVAAAGRGDEQAWSVLVARYTPLVWAVVNRFRLDRADAADVNQTVWLRLVEHLHRLREPAALPMWIAKTARHECVRVLRTSSRTRSFDPLDGAGEGWWAAAALVEDAAVDDELLRAERQQALRDGFAQLPPRCRELLALLLREPPISYEQVGTQLGIPVGSVGPTRGRCLHKLRSCPALAAFLGADPDPGRGSAAGKGAHTGRGSAAGIGKEGRRGTATVRR